MWDLSFKEPIRAHLSLPFSNNKANLKTSALPTSSFGRDNEKGIYCLLVKGKELIESDFPVKSI
jgi:hypothetical protein